VPAATPASPAASLPTEAATPGFRTFTLTKPQSPHAAAAAARLPAPSPAGSSAAVPGRELRVTSFWRLSPGGISAGLDLGSEGPTGPFHSSMEWSGRAGLGLDRAMAEIGLGRYRLRVGDDHSELYGAGQGVRWGSRAPTGPGIAWGVGLLQPYGASDTQVPRAAADLRWSPAKGLAATADAGMDGSWRLGTDLAGGRVTTALSVGRIVGFRDSDTAAITQYRIKGDTFLYSRLGQWRGRHPGDLVAVGARTRWHGTSLWLEEARGEQDGEAQTQDALGFFVPGHRLQWGARLQRTARSDPPGAGGALDLGADLFYQASERMRFWLQSNTSQLGGDNRTARLLAGLSFHPTPALELRAERTVQSSGAAVPWQFLVRRRTAANMTLGLFYAPVPVRDGRGGARLGIEWGRSFDLPLTRPGRIQGEVRVGDKRCRERVAVLLDGRRRAWTGSAGQWRFDRVPAGVHTVRLDLEHLPARFGVPQGEQTLRVSGGHTTEATLPLVSLGGISGRVTVAADGGPAVPGQVEPPELDGITITLSNDRVTSTGRDGSFSFQNLKAGPYTIRLAVGTLPEGCELRGPASWDVTVADGADVTGAEFLIAPIRRPIRFFRTDEKPAR